MRDDSRVRTTLDLEDDILQAAKELAELRGVTTGKAVSDLVRKALAPAKPSRLRNGVPVLPTRRSGAVKPTMKLVNELRDA